MDWQGSADKWWAHCRTVKDKEIKKEDKEKKDRGGEEENNGPLPLSTHWIYQYMYHDDYDVQLTLDIWWTVFSGLKST